MLKLTTHDQRQFPTYLAMAVELARDYPGEPVYLGMNLATRKQNRLFVTRGTRESTAILAMLTLNPDAITGEPERTFYGGIAWEILGIPQPNRADFLAYAGIPDDYSRVCLRAYSD